MTRDISESHPAWEQIEPAAIRQEDPDWPGQYEGLPGEHEIELSKAISLKRIADFMCGSESNCNMVEYMADQTWRTVI